MTDNAPIRLDREGIYQVLKNRDPLLFVDDVLVEPGKGSWMERTIPADAWFFACHFPGDPMMPGVLQLETLFQTSALAIKLLDGYKDKTTNIAQITGARFSGHIRPGDTISVSTQIHRFRHGVAAISGEIHVGETLCCAADFVLAVLDDMPGMKRGME